MARFASIGIVSILLLSMSSGCNRQQGGYNGPRGTVSGRLIVDGAPLTEGCKVMFQAVDGGYIATATVKSDGKYTLTSNGSFEIPAVNYKVQFAPPESNASVSTPSSGLQDPSEMAKKVMGPPGSREIQQKAKPPFPAKYMSTLTSKLEYAVKAGANKADFDLSP